MRIVHGFHLVACDVHGAAVTLGLASFAANIPVDVGLLVCRSFSFVSRNMSSKSFSCVSSFGISTDLFTRCLYYYTYALEKIYIFAALVY